MRCFKRSYLFLFCLSFHPILAASEITMVMPRSHDSYYGMLFNAIYKEAFDRLDVSLTTLSCTPVKCSYHMKQGTADGELGRPKEYQKYFPNLIRIASAPLAINLSAFSTRKNLQIKQFSDFRNSGLIVAFNPGYLFLKQQFDLMKEEVSIVGVKTWQAGLAKLAAQEVDIYIAIEQTIMDEIKAKNYTEIRNVGVIQKIPLHAYLSDNFVELVPKLSKTIDDMKMDGTINKFVHMAKKSKGML